jgi:DnaJ like chaperone protein
MAAGLVPSFWQRSRNRVKNVHWQGKVIGGLVGLAAGPVGVLLGLALGHSYDLAQEARASPGDPEAIAAALFATAFAVMGHVAKADGRVSESEIDAARAIMDRMQLSPAQRAAAVAYYTRGKSSEYPLGAELRRLRELCGPRHDLLLLFLDLELRAALAGNDLAGAARARLQAIAQALGFGGLEFASLEAALRRDMRAAGSIQTSAERLSAAYALLGVRPAASDEDVKKAYRRQMNDNHPDKLLARGLPESMQELAKEKTQRIREAYEAIAAHRSLR